jgi:CBS domain containing-hemolysin-like protein
MNINPAHSALADYGHGLYRVAAAGGASADPDASFTKLVAYVMLALFVSFLCSMLEAVLLSSSRSHLEIMAQQGRKAGRLMLSHKANVEKSISAILTLNTVAHTAGSVGAGAQAKGLYGDAEALIAIILTLLILIFSEIIPKTVGTNYWRRLTPFSAYAIQIMVILLYPAVWALQKMTQLISPRERGPIVSRIELQALAALSRSEGSIGEREHRIFANLMKLDLVRVRDVMTPRIVLTTLPARLTISQVLSEYGNLRHSRIPIYQDDIDDMIGFVLRVDIMRAAAEDRDDLVLAELTRKLHSVPETMTVASALEEFSSRREHLFLVVDEYGGTAGILTLEDSIETLLGIEITDESDLVEDMRQLARARYEKRLATLGAAEVEQ